MPEPEEPTFPDDGSPFDPTTPAFDPPLRVPIWQSDMPLVIKGSPDITAETTLYLGSISPDPSGTVPLTIDGPPANQIPLVIGRDQSGSGIATLYIDGVASFGGDNWSSETTLFVEGMANNATPFVNNPAPPLVITGPPSEDASGDIPLVIDGAPVVITTASGQAPLFVSGSAPSSSNPESTEQFGTLFIRNTTTFNEDGAVDIPLHIETDFNIGVTTSLYVNSTISSGVVPLVVARGANLSNSGIPLFVRTPESGDITLFTKGFRS